MPRATRIQYKNAFYHVMNRGKGRQTIFHDKNYYDAFLDTLKESHDRFDAIIHCYCLMSNHYHLLIETPRANLDRIMRHINGIYTQRYNRLQKTDGPLFRGRYKAILVDKDAYLLQLSRYIHRNPIEIKGPKPKLEDYSWSSYPAYIEKAPTPHWLQRDNIYQMLGQRQRYAGYRAFVAEGIDDELTHYYGKGNIAAVLGDASFKKQIIKKNKLNNTRSLQQALQPRASANTIISVVASVFDVNESQIQQSSDNRRIRNDARKLALYYCQQYGDISLNKIADKFELKHAGSASRLIHDAKRMISDGEFLSQTKKIEKLLLIIQ